MQHLYIEYKEDGKITIKTIARKGGISIDETYLSLEELQKDFYHWNGKHYGFYRQNKRFSYSFTFPDSWSQEKKNNIQDTFVLNPTLK